MINKIKIIAKMEDKKQLLSNFISLSILQGANYILPLITFPYLVRVLGVEYFGLLAFATATITYFSILTDYGFNLTATREISIHRDNQAKVIEIFSSVMSIKVILMFISFLLLTILVFSFEKFSKDALIYFLTFGSVVGQVLFPVWFFQGMEWMKYITYINIASRLLFTVTIFIFVQEQSDFYMVPVLSAFGTIMGGLYALYFIRINFDVKFSFQKLNILKIYFLDGWHIFLSTAFISLYSNSMMFLLGIFTNNTAVGYFSIADKVVQAVNSFREVVIQTLYPYLARLFRDSKKKYFDQLNIIFLLALTVSLAIVLCIMHYSELIINILSATKIQAASEVLTVLSLKILITALNVVLGTLFLIATNNNKYIAYITFIGALTGLISMTYFIFGESLTALTASYCIILSELVILIYESYLYFKLKKRMN